MKKDCDECFGRDYLRRNHRREFVSDKINALTADLIEKEEEIMLYKERLKELESAFYYNLELISERDLELNVLEKQLIYGNEQLQQVLQEKDELEDVLESLDKKNERKIQDLETKLNHSEEKIRALQKENLRNIHTIKKMSSDVRGQEWKKLIQLTAKLDADKKKLIESYQREMEEKEKYYLLEIDSLSAKIEEFRQEKGKFKKAEEENRSLRHHLADMEKLLRKKESVYMEEWKKANNKEIRKVNQETQCKLIKKVADKHLQAQVNSSEAESQTSSPLESGDHHQCKKKLMFFQEQNEVLKCVIKDLKKNNNNFEGGRPFKSEENCSDCANTKLEVRAINEKFESEINCLKKILIDEQSQRAEEEAVIENLEASMNCLKDKMLAEFQSKSGDFKGGGAGGDVCNYNCNHFAQNQLQVSVLEQKLSKKIDCLISAAQQEREKVNEKLEQLKKECLEKIEESCRPKKESTEMRGENLLEKIRSEILKLENKIESDMKNIVRNNSERDKCDKNYQTRIEFNRKGSLSSDSLARSQANFLNTRELKIPYELPRVCRRRGDVSGEHKCVGPSKSGREAVKFQNQFGKRRSGEEKSFKQFRNDLVVGR